jgi:hypothetical protein
MSTVVRQIDPWRSAVCFGLAIGIGTALVVLEMIISVAFYNNPLLKSGAFQPSVPQRYMHFLPDDWLEPSGVILSKSTWVTYGETVTHSKMHSTEGDCTLYWVEAGWPLRWADAVWLEDQRNNPYYQLLNPNAKVYSTVPIKGQWAGYPIPTRLADLVDGKWFPTHVRWIPLAVNVLIHCAALWLLATLFASLVSAAVRRRRRKKCCCPSCGYPLSGLDDNAKCPECGFRPGAPTKRTP